MGVVVELLLGVGGFVDPWCWMGECHTAQCSACQSCWEGACWKTGSMSSGVSVCCGSGVVEGLCGPVYRLGLRGLGHTDSRHSRVTFGEGFG